MINVLLVTHNMDYTPFLQENFCEVNKHKESLTLFNPLSANFTKWSNTLKQFVGKLRNFDAFMNVHSAKRNFRVYSVIIFDIAIEANILVCLWLFIAFSVKF